MPDWLNRLLGWQDLGATQVAAGQTFDADYAEYARRRLAAFLSAAGIRGVALCIQADNGGLSLVARLVRPEPEDIAAIPKQVDGLTVTVVY
jgi:hypothetical protein